MSATYCGAPMDYLHGAIGGGQKCVRGWLRMFSLDRKRQYIFVIHIGLRFFT
jgi:hypothetical protein